MKRHLPVLPGHPATAGEPSRPGWQWVLIGGVFVFTAWMPLIVVAGWLSAFVGLALTTDGSGAGPDGHVMLAGLVLSLALASGIGGALVGRFGDRARARHAVLGALTAVFTTWLLAWLAGALQPWPVAVGSALGLALVGAPASGFGYRVAVSRYRRVTAPRALHVDRGAGQH